MHFCIFAKMAVILKKLVFPSSPKFFGFLHLSLIKRIINGAFLLGKSLKSLTPYPRVQFVKASIMAIL